MLKKSIMKNFIELVNQMENDGVDISITLYAEEENDPDCYGSTYVNLHRGKTPISGVAGKFLDEIRGEKKEYHTFKDLLDYIQDADRDECGMHIPIVRKDYVEKFLPHGVDVTELLLHIFSSRRRVNVCIKEEGSNIEKPVAGFYFIGDDLNPGTMQVMLIPVVNGYANYDITDNIATIDTNFNDIDWSYYFGPYSGLKDIIDDILVMM